LAVRLHLEPVGELKLLKLFLTPLNRGREKVRIKEERGKQKGKMKEKIREVGKELREGKWTATWHSKSFPKLAPLGRVYCFTSNIIVFNL